MGSKKKVCECNDVMSQLPDPIIGHILGFLPLNYAVRTCALSREWRYKYLELSKFEYLVKQERCLLGILGVLEAHSGSILDFSLFIPDNLKSLATFDKILKLVFKKGIRKLALQNAEEISPIFYLNPTIDTHSSLFSCSDLSHLVLRECVLESPPPEFTGFTTKLVTLSLREVVMTTQLLSTLISQSPLLQSVDVVRNIYPILSGNLEVDAPNLSFCHFQAHFNGLITVSSPRLKQVRVTMTRHSGRCYVKQHEHDSNSTVLQLKSADSIESLHLDHCYTNALHRCGSSRLGFEHLRVLRLSEICFGVAFEVKRLLDMMKSCVSLEKLIIEAFCEPLFEDEDVEFDHDALDLSCSRIREVQMLDISGTSETELAFIETLLLKLLKLETMVIAPDLRNFVDQHTLVYTPDLGEDICIYSPEIGEYICVYKRLKRAVLRFRRTSPLATIDFRPAKTRRP